jgi:ring-1,2-phenylacetyl-CoA epoxidase subunit PaaE
MEQLLREYRLCPPAEAMHYACGPYEYMRMAAIALTDDGVPAAQIRKEDFQPLQLVPKELPPDTEPHQVRLSLAGHEYTLQVQYPDTVLKAAKKAGIPIPYSCEAGRCGTCVARCDSGKVWMSYNEVLLDEEIAAGRVLTCTGYPFGGDASLSF